MRPPINRNLNQRIRQALYQMKKDYGAPIDIVKLVSSSTDVRTGEIVLIKKVTHVRRAVVLPARMDRSAKRTISIISANKEFVTGGTYDAAERNFIVDRRDVPALPELTADDWILYNRHKYQIKTVESFEVDAGWVIAARQLVGEIAENIVDVRVDSSLDLVESDSHGDSVQVGETLALTDSASRGDSVQVGETLALTDSATQTVE